jgi:galactonate dehydratase
MKITDVKALIARGPWRNLCIVKVETDSGYYGWGESGLIGRELAVKGAIEHFREFLIGKDARRMGALWQEMYRGQYFEGGRVLTAAISAIDIALYDVVAKSLGVPVYQLLGGAHRDRVPCFTTSHAAMGPDAVEDARRLVNDGWPSIRFTFGEPDTGGDPALFEPRESIALTAEWMMRIREAVGPVPVLGMEYHHRLSVAEAASFCQRMPSGTLDFLEEPIRDETPEAYEALRRMTDVPFAIGEEFASKWQFLPYIERGIANFARIDLCNVGGFTEAMKVAGWCEAHYIDMMPHNPLGPISTAANLHFAAAVPNYAWLEERTSDLVFGPEYFSLQPEIDGITFAVPEGPGLGVEFTEAAVEEHPFEFWEAGHLHRRDGSYTNY